jgi:hypothetical protein
VLGVKTWPLWIAAALAGLSWSAGVWPGVWAGAVLAVASVALWRRALVVDVALRRQHYLQACGQLCVFLYWGWYWTPVQSATLLILAQVLFAFGFDWLWQWFRRGRYTLGFGPVPIVFSMNLFLWFKPEWFAWQFVIVALAFVAKDTLRWTRNGCSTHIFNPSAFPLAVASVVLLTTGRSGITWGPEIANTQFYPPYMYLFLFLIGMPGQFLFGVTLMTASAVVSTYLFGLAYFGWTGIYFFYDAYIPISVFLGMHLLFTDPATAPRSELGRILFGCLYGLSTVALYQLLGLWGMPAFYDKLLQVPLLNASVKGIDALAARIAVPRFCPTWTGVARHAGFVSVWAVVFAAMSGLQGVGDRHPGQWLPFWRQACADGRAYACPYLADTTEAFCKQGSPWACNEAGLLHLALARSGEDARRAEERGAAVPLRRGCTLGLDAACWNVQVLESGQGDYRRSAPTMEDLPVVLRGSKGEVRERGGALLTLACTQGWRDVCGSLTVAVE